jgi:putative PIN family toxin of toxin-antitoxin system
MKVVIDTNIWISYLLGSLLQGMDEKILSKEIKVVVSDEMLKEISEVSSRPKFKNIFTAKRIKELFSLLDSYAIVVSPSQKVNVCRDGKDNFLLEVALEGEADYLVTGDEDLLVINTFQSTKIIRPKEFEDMFNSQSIIV